MTYPLTERVRTLSVVMLFLLILPFHANASASNVADFVQRCGVSTVVASAHVAYDHDKNRWKEYPSPKQIPANEEWSGTAYLWNKPKSPVVIDVEGLGEDFSDSAFYCFDNSGKLLSLEHEFRTAWGWGFTEKKQFDGAGKETAESHFFNTKDRTEIPRPQGANDVSDTMTVRVYKTLSDVPFFWVFPSGTRSKF
jgi:hypothetical protein